MYNNDMTNYMTYNMTMKTLNVAHFKAHLSEYLEAVEAGEEISLCRRNIPVARIIPIPKPKKNRTQLGYYEGKAMILGDIIEPGIPLEDWNMLKPGLPGKDYPNDY